MPTLPSGLPEYVGDLEPLSRFLTQSNQFNTHGAKPAAFLPNPKYQNTSVFRIGNQPERLRLTWAEIARPDRSLKGAAILTAAAVRGAGLEVLANEPPPAHADIAGWPWVESDPELQKARQIEKAAVLAGQSQMITL